MFYTLFASSIFQSLRNPEVHLDKESVAPPDEEARGGSLHMARDNHHAQAMADTESGVRPQDKVDWESGLRLRIHQHQMKKQRLFKKWHASIWEVAQRWFQKNWEPTYFCPLERRLGDDEKIGGKWICDTDRYRHAVQTCVVFSIGDFREFSFEEDLRRMTSDSCKNYAFGSTKPSNLPTFVSFFGTDQMIPIAKELQEISILKVQCKKPCKAPEVSPGSPQGVHVPTTVETERRNTLY